MRDYAIFFLDPTGHVASWNSGAMNAKGYKAHEIIGTHFSVFYPPEAPHRALELLARAAAEGRVEDVGWRVRKDGSRFWADVVTSRVNDSSGKLIGFTKVTRDLTDRRAAEEAVRASEERALRAAEETAPRQLKLQGLTRALQGMPRETGRLATALRQTERMTSLVDRLLDVSRLSQGRLELAREEFDFAILVRQVTDDFREHAMQSLSPLHVQTPDVLPGVWDRLRIEQAVVNLLSNAVEYGAGKPIEVRLTGDEERLRLEIVDHGIGISVDDQKRIFGRFERAVSARNYGGMGLGLYVTRHIVEAHGGSIHVESSLAAGSTFILELPRAAAAPHPEVRA